MKMRKNKQSLLSSILIVKYKLQSSEYKKVDQIPLPILWRDCTLIIEESM